MNALMAQQLVEERFFFQGKWKFMSCPIRQDLPEMCLSLSNRETRDLSSRKCMKTGPDVLVFTFYQPEGIPFLENEKSEF